jgi:hypothetical protein
MKILEKNRLFLCGKSESCQLQKEPFQTSFSMNFHDLNSLPC